MNGNPLALTSLLLVVSILAICLPSPVSFARASDVAMVDDFWTRSEMENRPGSGVWRFDLDLDGDEQPEILLANQELAGKHGDLEWQVYKCVKGLRYRFLGSLSFSRVGFQVLQGPARVEALWFSDEHDRDASG